MTTDDNRPMVIKNQEPARPCVPEEPELDEPRPDEPELNGPEPEELDEAWPTVIGPDGKPMPARGLVLGVEKFRKPAPKYFRLIWINPATQEAWLAEENRTEFRKKHGDGGIVEVGQDLAKQLRAKRFSQVTR